MGSQDNNKAKTALSTGELVYGILSEDAAVMAIATDVFPVMSPTEAALPFVVYARTELTAVPDTRAVAHTIKMGIMCLAADYDTSVALAEAVTAALDHRRLKTPDLDMRSATLTGAVETFEGDAYIQELEFTLKIS